MSRSESPRAVEPAIAPWGPPRAAYVHVPFCRHRCGYCDFTLIAGRDDLIDRYLDALALEIERELPGPVEVDTLFFGGGTPSHLSPDQLARLFGIVGSRISLVPEGECSIEANPLDLDNERLAALVQAGVNRVSIGVQSFQPGELRLLERDHTGIEARDAVRRVRRAIPNVGVDLIFGTPGQSLADWSASLEACLALEPAHVSTYGLTFEKGTSFWSRRERGALRQSPEDLEREMYELAMEQLPAAGVPQYEISNFARPGFECRHNETYWDARSCWAFGPGAASYLGGVRRQNHRSTTTWIARTLTREVAPPALVEELSPEDRAREAAMLGLRRTRGIDSAAFERRFGAAPRSLAGAAFERLVSAGWLEESSGWLRLTREGRCVADTVLMEFLSPL
ncbi:MAG: radical SAM family heme chaperone HemW [Planctomyces sp.]|nr:radical SAM family heme chaperone HemW [Planctomyces sp.]